MPIIDANRPVPVRSEKRRLTRIFPDSDLKTAEIQEDHFGACRRLGKQNERQRSFCWKSMQKCHDGRHRLTGLARGQTQSDQISQSIKVATQIPPLRQPRTFIVHLAGAQVDDERQQRLEFVRARQKTQPAPLHQSRDNIVRTEQDSSVEGATRDAIVADQDGEFATKAPRVDQCESKT
jgi:hypothetical protein